MAGFINSKVVDKAVLQGNMVAIRGEITIQELDKKLIPFSKRLNELKTQLNKLNLEIQKQEIYQEIKEKEGEFKISYIEAWKDILFVLN